MTAPAKRVSVRLSALPEPELVSLIGDPSGPYANSPDGWWTEPGGALDSASGAVYFPPTAQLPACPFPCSTCRAKGRQR
jgi:hypothetical protein